MTPNPTNLILAFGSFRYCATALEAAKLRSLAAPEPQGLDALERADAMVFEMDVEAAEDALRAANESPRVDEMARGSFRMRAV